MESTIVFTLPCFGMTIQMYFKEQIIT